MAVSMKPRVLLVAPMGPHSLGRYYERGFRQLGCSVHVFDYETPDRFSAAPSQSPRGWKELVGSVRRKNLEWGRPLTRLRRVFSGVFEARRHRSQDIALLETAVDVSPDIVFVINGLHIELARLQDIQTTTGSKLFFFHTEDFLCLPEMHPKLFLKALPFYNCVFTATYENLDEYREYGARRAEFLPFAFDPYDHHPPKLNTEDYKEFGAEVTFVGKWWHERAATLEGVVDICQIAVWGGGWQTLPQSSPLRPFVKGRLVMGIEMPKVYAASKICLNNLTRRPNRHGHLMRTFEIAACGGFQLSERSEETLAFFEEGKEIECYGSLEECREKIKYYLSHETERRKIAERGYERCRNSCYSYSDRAKQILLFRDIC